MFFNSLDFGIFFPLVFLLYWTFFNKSTKAQNYFFLAISYIFYGWWDWRFLSLIIVSSLVDFWIGKKLGEESTINRKLLLGISLGVNIGFLSFFKYSNFFIDSFVQSFSLFGTDLAVNRLDIILPVGISFYTFQTLSYTIDIFRKKLAPTKDPIAFFAFVSFFPQLVAGPIERARDLLPQFSTVKVFSYENARSGLLLMSWGFFKKIVIADRLAIFVDAVYLDLEYANGLVALVAIVFFAFQLYLDFSAYSDIAIGCARTLGFKLSTNFKRPYLASSFSDFWQRWHISLSTWFRDYLYIPLGGNRRGYRRTIINILLVFTVSGLWHGASWNFVVWGGLNGLFLILFDRFFAKKTTSLLHRVLASILVTSMWTLSLIFFRSPTFGEASTMLTNLWQPATKSILEFGLNIMEFKFTVTLLFLYVIAEFILEKKRAIYPWFSSQNLVLRWSFYFALIASIIFLGSYGAGKNDNTFIYFQF